MLDKVVVIRWLLSHTGVLRQLAEIVGTWNDRDTLAHKLEVVYRVAQAVLPVIETFPLFQAQATALTAEEAEDDLDQVRAMGIGIPIMINVIAPLVIGLLRMIMDRDRE